MIAAGPSPPPPSLLQEQRYRKQFLRADGRQTAIVMGVASLCWGVAAGTDFVLLEPGLIRALALASRVVFAAAVAFAIVLIGRAKWPRQQARAFNVALGGAAVGVAGSLTRLEGGHFQGAVLTAVALLCVLYFAQRGPLVPRALLGGFAGLVVVALLVNPAAPVETPARYVGGLVVVALNVIGIFSARSFEEQRRKRFDAERRERHARQELAVNLRDLAVAKERAEANSLARAAFLAAMSHEFRTPMNAVIGLSDLLLDAPLAHEHWRHVRTISESARALLALLNDILDFAKIDAQKLSLSPAPFDLRRLAASVVEMLRPQAQARALELTLALSPGVPEVLAGDDARLRQVLVNLVANAVKFTERGAVTLRITASPPEGGEHEIRFRVEDTGIGMAPEVSGRLFRPFEQADGGIARRHGGTGLGLAISKQIVLAMGGDLQVESEPGRGSVFSFTLRLPAAAAPPEITAPAQCEDRLPLAILVVDDHPINRDVAHAKLGSLGYRVDLADGGQAAIEAVTNKDYDVVFMDLRMPGMSGIEATARIGERLAGKRAPHVVAMTASVFEEDRDACRRAGMRDFVGKPIDLVQLDAVLSRVAEERGAAKPRERKGATLAREQLAKLQQIDGPGEPHFFANLCRLFIAEMEKRIPRLGEALGRGDMKAIEDEAHILKSTSAALGASELSELCGRVEGAARAGRIEEIQAVLDALSLQQRAVARALTQVVQGEPLPPLGCVAEAS